MQGMGVAIVALCMLTATACVRTLPGQDPPETARLYYPNRMALSQDNNSLLVVNTNFDERYNVGWVTKLDLPILLPILNAAARAGTVADANAIAPAWTQAVRIPSLAGDLVVDHAHARAYLAHRGQGLITTLDIIAGADGATTVSCGDALAPDAQRGLTHLEQQTSCDRAHLFDLGRASLAQDANIDARRWLDPFALALVAGPNTGADGDYPVLVAGFLGSATLLALQPGPLAQDLGVRRALSLGAAALGQLLPIPDSRLSPYGGTLLGTTHYVPGTAVPSALFAIDVAQWLSLAPAQAEAAINRYALGTMLGATDSAADITGATFSPRDATRLYVSHRNTDALVLLARELTPLSSFDAEGAAQIAPTVSTSVRASAVMGDGRLSQVAYIARDAGDVLAVLSLAGDMLYLFDVSDDTLVLAGRYAFAPGQGPVSLAHVQDGARHYLFVTTFFDHGLTVLDVSQANLGSIRLAASIFDDTRLTPDAQH